MFFSPFKFISKTFALSSFRINHGQIEVPVYEYDYIAKLSDISIYDEVVPTRKKI